MKKVYFLLILFGGFLFTMCTNSEKKVHFKTYEEASHEFISSLTHMDTVAVLKLSTDVMELLKNDKIDEALDSLYMIKDSQLYKLDSNKKQSLRNRFKMFPVLDYKYENLSFTSQGINDIKYTIRFHIDSITNNSKSMVLMFNPVKVEGNWYITVKEKGQLSNDTDEQIHPQSFAPKEITLPQK